jgi:hypothetical protein
MHCRRCHQFLSGMCLVVIALLGACAAAPAPKAACDTDLRPINPPQHPLP